MKIEQITKKDLESIQAIGFDIDDTLTTHGKIKASTLAALERLKKETQLKLILITGRPAGWANAFIKFLPVDGIVSENGSVLYYWPAEDSISFESAFWTSNGYLSQYEDRDMSWKTTVLEQSQQLFPQVKVASDQHFRLYDFAVDFAEEIENPLNIEQAYQIKQIYLNNNCEAKVSSIHVNGWRGNFSKLNGMQELARRWFKEDNFSVKSNMIFVGDSGNDSPLFEAVDFSVGVANVKRFVGKDGFCSPKYICENEEGQGAEELVEKLMTQF